MDSKLNRKNWIADLNFYMILNLQKYLFHTKILFEANKNTFPPLNIINLITNFNVSDAHILLSPV